MTPSPHPINTALLALAYSQVETLELMCGGATRDQAVDASWKLFYQHLAPLAAEPDVVQEWAAGLRTAYRGRHPQPRYWCLAASAGRNARILRANHDPSRLLRPDQAATLAWQLETLRRVADGQPLLRAARAAHDAHQRKPRQRRQPVSRDWLTDQVTQALDDLWTQIHANAGHTSPAGRPAWMDDPQARQHTGPAWTNNRPIGVVAPPPPNERR